MLKSLLNVIQGQFKVGLSEIPWKKCPSILRRYLVRIVFRFQSSTTLVPCVHGFETRVINIIEGVQWSNPCIQWRAPPENRVSTAPSFNAVFAGSVPSCDDLMTTLPESYTRSTHHLLTRDDLQADQTMQLLEECHPPELRQRYLALADVLTFKSSAGGTR